jgi:signal transduction histidine kinase
MARPRRALVAAGIAIAVALAAIAALSAAVAPTLQLLMITQGATLAVCIVAAAGFAAHRGQPRDALMPWLAAGTVLAAFSQLNYLLLPSLHTDWISVADTLRVVGGLMLLWGAVCEVVAYEARLGRAAVTDERRRIARELHDGLIQELAYISSQCQRLPREDPAAARISAASARALDEARDAVAALSRRNEEPFYLEVARAAEQVTGRASARLRLDLDPTVELPFESRHALVRIVREAVTNATRHGSANEVSVTLKSADGLRLQIDDDGAGFDTHVQTGPGFGITSMRERAASLGGDLHLASHPGRGTHVEVLLP